MGEYFEAHSTKSSDMALQKKMCKELKKLLDESSFMRRDKLTPLLLDLAEYDSDRANQKALMLLNTLFCVKDDLFELGLDALVLITEESNSVSEKVSHLIPQIQSILKAKWTNEQAETLEGIFEQLKKCCLCPNTGEPHPMNQKILTSSNILNVVFQVLTVETDTQLSNKYVTVERVFRRAMEFLRVLTHKNQDLQFKIFERIDELLTVNFVDTDLALALIQVFGNNMNLCLRVTPRHVQKIMARLADSHVRAPELVDLLLTIAKVNDLPLKRNQQMIMKYLMQNFSTVANGLERPKKERIRILKGKDGVEQQKYFLKILELLAVCNEGDNRFIQSLSQNIISEEEAIEVITDPEMPLFALNYMIRFFCSVYLGRNLTEESKGSALDQGQTWNFFERIAEECAFVVEATNDRRGMDIVDDIVEKPFNPSDSFDPDDMEQRLHSFLFSNTSSLCMFFKLFFKQNFASTISCDEESETLILQRLTRNYCEAMSKVLPFCKKPGTIKEIIESCSILHCHSYLPQTVIEQVTECSGCRPLHQIMDDLDMMEDMCQHGEVELNLKLKTFTINCSLLYVGHNTVKAQLKAGNSKREYTSVGGMDALPLGEEFQQHISCFVKSAHHRVETKFKHCEKLIRQLEVSAHLNYTTSVMFGSSSAVRKEQEKLDIRCLQILRAIIHNEERQLPADWPTRTAETRIKNALKTIEKIQSFFASVETSKKILPHLANPKDRMLKEVLSLQASLLFNANRVSQQTLIDYFYGTREEVFFYAVRLRMLTSADILKEQRSLKEQRAARKKLQSKAASPVDQGSVGAQALLMMGKQNEARSSSTNTGTVLTRRVNLAQVQSKSIRRSRMLANGNGTLASRPNSNEVNNNHNTSNSGRHTKSFCSEEDVKLDLGHHNSAYDTIDRETALELKTVSGDGKKTAVSHSLLSSEDDDDEEFESGDDTVGLVLRVLAAVCDGQHHQLQNYLRSQPDNVKSFNLVAEVVQFLDVVYTNIDEYNVELVIEIFSTLNELSVGNRENRTTIYDSKVMDFINFILRAGNYPNIPLEKTMELWNSIAILLIAMIEENDPESLVIASEVRETLDKESIYRIMHQSYRLHTHSDADSSVKEAAEDLGFQLYIILARLLDINPSGKLRHVTPEQMKAFKYYKKNSMSVELLKDNNVQKCHFRVKNKQMVREEVKEMVKWCLDRTSPSNKLRDFMEWSRVILKDSIYQRRILRSSLMRLFTGYWLTWNYSILILSLVICIMLLIGRVAPQGHAITIDNPVNQTVPLVFYTQPTDVWAKEYEYMKVVTFVLGILHNIFSFLVCFTYFLANHPPLPKFQTFLQYFVSKRTEDEEEADLAKSTNTKTTSAPLISTSTLFYLAILAFSIAGTVYNVYFFSFHLLNIVNNNPTLQGVIKAITKNGVSLLLVALLGIIIIFFFAIAGFVFFRSGMNGDSLMYCDTLAKCFFTHIRFGIVGDLLENAIPHEGEQTFYRFVHFVIFHLTFYILVTTIGLNMIFGIIVDTFSELRDLKWQAEADMRDTCFICSRDNFEFEHSGKGFAHHVKEEHNMWSYVFFFIHLQETKLNDLTAIELHVQKLLDIDSSDFFPFNRATCLATKNEDAGVSISEQLLSNIRKLHQFQVTELAEKRRQREIERQRRWRGQFGRRSGQGSSLASTLEPLEPQGRGLRSSRSMNRKPLGNAFSPIHSSRIPKHPQDFDQQTRKATDHPSSDHHPSSPPTPPHSPPREYIDDDYGQEGPTQNYEYSQHDPMQFLDDYDVHSDE